MSPAEQEFLDKFLAAVDFQDPPALTMNTELASLPEWDSLAGLGVIIMFDVDYGVTITGEDLLAAKTLRDLFALTPTRAAA